LQEEMDRQFQVVHGILLLCPGGEGKYRFAMAVMPGRYEDSFCRAEMIEKEAKDGKVDRVVAAASEDL
jgi:hypothetical protein